MTITDARRPAWDTLEEALRQRRALQITYHGRRRTVSAHALGWKNGKAMLLAYQTSSDTTPPAPTVDPTGQWRCFHLDQIEQIDTAEPTTKWATADTYNPARPFNTIDHVAIAITP
jgi:predicted DNA-binding transcriptional regulator YafY